MIKKPLVVIVGGGASHQSLFQAMIAQDAFNVHTEVHVLAGGHTGVPRHQVNPYDMGRIDNIDDFYLEPHNHYNEHANIRKPKAIFNQDHSIRKVRR